MSATAASARGGCISPSTMANVHAKPKLHLLHHVRAAAEHGLAEATRAHTRLPAEAAILASRRFGRQPNFEHRQEMPMQPRIRAEDAAEDARAAAAAAGASAGAAAATVSATGEAAAAGGGCISPSTTAASAHPPAHPAMRISRSGTRISASSHAADEDSE